MNRSAVVISHVLFEDLGIFGPVLAEEGFSVRYIDAARVSVELHQIAQADLLVVLGGPIGVGDAHSYPFIDTEIEILTERLAAGHPVLGVCLGAQLMAAALGAEVSSAGRVEIGFGPLTLTQAGHSSALGAIGQTPVLHWHGDQFAIPSGAAKLASTDGFPNQAFAYGPNALALQFHLEADVEFFDRWLIGHAHELAANGINPNQLRSDASKFGPRLTEVARGILLRWLHQILWP